MPVALLPAVTLPPRRLLREGRYGRQAAGRWGGGHGRVPHTHHPCWGLALAGSGHQVPSHSQARDIQRAQPEMEHSFQDQQPGQAGHKGLNETLVPCEANCALFSKWSQTEQPWARSSLPAASQAGPRGWSGFSASGISLRLPPPPQPSSQMKRPD